MEVKALFDKLKQTKKIVKMKQSDDSKSVPTTPASKTVTDSNIKKAIAKKKKKDDKQTKKFYEPEQSKNGRKQTDEGFKVYTEDELKIGDTVGGQSKDCPFDCDCCY